MNENKFKNSFPALYYPPRLITEKKLTKRLNKKYKNISWLDLVKEIDNVK